MTLKELTERQTKLMEELRAADEADDQEKFDSLSTEMDGIKSKIERKQKLEDEERNLNRSDGSVVGGDQEDEETEESLRDFQKSEEKRQTKIEFANRTSRNFANGEAAYRFGQFMRAAVFGNQAAARYCKKNGIALRYQSEGTDADGGALVPAEFAGVLCDLREKYGVARRNCLYVPMLRDTKKFSASKGGAVAYHTTEAGAGTASDLEWLPVDLVAQLASVIIPYTDVWAEDTIINVADTLADGIASAMAKREDDDLFLGDGTAAYGSVTGLIEGLDGVSGGAYGLVSAAAGTDDDWSGITMANFRSMNALLSLIYEAGAKWYFSKTFWADVVEPLILAAGGATAENFQDGAKRKFLGYDVELVSQMPSAATTAEIVALLGDLKKTAAFGDRREITLSYSKDATVGSVKLWEQNMSAIKGTERFDIDVFNLGSSTAAGGVIGLKTVVSA